MVEGIAKTIRERRSIREYRDEPVDRQLIIELLRDAVWAPNHLKEEPWRFILIDGIKKEIMVEGMYDYYKNTGYLDKFSETQLIKIKEHFLQIPAHLVVIMNEEKEQKKWDEAFGATCALIQNFQLLAWEKGLGVVWKTNQHNYSSEFKEKIVVKENEKIVGILQLGYPKSIPSPKPRRLVEENLTILGE